MYSMRSSFTVVWSAHLGGSGSAKVGPSQVTGVVSVVKRPHPQSVINTFSIAHDYYLRNVLLYSFSNPHQTIPFHGWNSCWFDAGFSEENVVEIEQLKTGMKWMWALGEYDQVAQRLMPHAELLAEAAGVVEGMTVLDVAAGNGNFAIAAARWGATVVATDLTPHMVELGRARSEADSLAVEWLEADAEMLPFDSDRFDLVASVFGAMFAPRPERVATELFRVAKPGGLVAMANYASEGFLGEFTGLLFRYGPASPLPLASPFLWGEADVIRQRFHGLASTVDVSPGSITFKFASAGHALEFWEQTNGPFIALRSVIAPEIYQEVSEQALRLITELNKSDGDGVVLDSAYTQVVARKSESERDEVSPEPRAW